MILNNQLDSLMQPIDAIKLFERAAKPFRSIYRSSKPYMLINKYFKNYDELMVIEQYSREDAPEDLQPILYHNAYIESTRINPRFNSYKVNNFIVLDFTDTYGAWFNAPVNIVFEKKNMAALAEWYVENKNSEMVED